MFEEDAIEYRSEAKENRWGRGTWSDVDGCKTRLKLPCMNASEQAANEEAK